MAAETFRIEIPINVRDNTDPGVSQATRKMNAFDRTNQRTQERLERMNRTKYQVVIDALDKASSIVQRIGTSVKGVAGKAWSITMKAVDLATAPIRGIINLLKNPIFQIGAAIGITIGIKDTIDTFAAFEQSMANAASVSGATGEEFERMTKLAKEMGKTTVFSASEAADAMYYMASAGYKAEQMEKSLGGVLSLAAATQTDLAAATDTVIATLNQFELQSDQASRVSDVFAASIGNSQATMDKLAYSMRYVGPIANSLNWSLEETTAALSILYNKGFRGEQAGTILRGALTQILNPSKNVISTLQEMGLAYDDINPSTKTFAEILGTLKSKAITTAQATALFGTEAGPGMIALIGEGREGLEEYIEILEQAGGAAETMAKRQLDTLQGAFRLLRSAAEGVKITIGERLKPHLAKFTTWLTQKMPDIEKAAGKAMDFIDEKIAWLSSTVNEFMSGEDWEKADVWGKIKIAWDKIVAEPFSAWWSSTGKAWFVEKASQIGEGIGTGMTAGLLALLGMDAMGAVDDGISIGASFADGFQKGFDGAKVGEAILNAIKGVFKDAGTLLPGGEEASSTSWISAALIGIVGAKIIKSLYNTAKGGATLWGDIKGILGKGSGSTVPPGTGIPAGYTTTTMAVSAQVVNVYGGTVNNVGNALKNVVTSGAGAAGGAALGAGGSALLLGKGASTAAAALPGATTLALPGATAAAGTAAGTGAVINTVQLASGTYVASGGALTTGLANTGVLLGSGATTAAGAAAVGGGSILGAIGGLLGIGSGIIDIFKGTRKEGKEAKDKYWQGGTKLGMVGTGAAAGAGVGALFGGIGAIPGALIGAGVGGIGALFGGSKLGKWLSDATDEQGAIVKWWGNTKEAVGGFFSETLPNFMAEQLPYAVGYASGSAVNFFTVSVPTFFTNLWNSVYGFFTETLPTWATGAFNKANEFFTQKVPEFFDGLWNSVSTFVTESIPEHAKELKDKITGWFGNFKDWAGDIWDKVKSSFSAGHEAGSGGGSNVAKHAYGGIMTKPHMGIVAEAGPEAIIPLSGEKRQRGIELWQRTGELLGVRPYADGGIVGQAGTLNTVNTVGAVVSQVTDVSKSIADLIEKVDVSKMLRPLGQAAKTIGKGINKIGYGAEAVFKRLPVIGAGMMIGSAALDTASAEDKKQAVATNAGSILGSIAGGFVGGAALGATGGAIFGAPGAAIGGAIGGIAGGIGGAIGGEAFAEWAYGQKDKIEKAFGEAWENVKAGATTAGAWLEDQFTAAKNAVGETWGGVSGWFEENVWEPIKTGATAAWNWVGEKLGGVGDWVGDKWTSFKDWLGGLGQKGSKATGLTTSDRKGSVLKHAYGGIMTKPHMGIVAEAGAEGIIPLSPSKRSQGIDVWQRVGEKLGVQAYGDGGIVGNETADVPTAAPAERSGQSISVKVEVSANPTFTIEGGDDTDESKILAVLKAYIREMVDDIGDELAERLARIFANMPVKGGAGA